jgi:uncharacterized protein with PIN domain
VKFITDVNLGKLAKWLRILGYNTVYHTGNADRNFLKKAATEGRIVLTRKKDMERRQFSGRLVIVHSDHVKEQISEVMDKLSFSPDPEQLFSICLRCNEGLVEVNREEVSCMVPNHVFLSHTEFFMCPLCKGVFWPGTHRENVQGYLRTHIQRHRL